jgi:tetratricopeptide (TPR) repeat protein
VTLSLAASAAVWGVHTIEPIALRRIESRVRQEPAWSGPVRASTFDFLGVRALNQGDAARAATFFEQAIAVGGPNPRLIHQAGLAYLAAGDIARARSSFELTTALNRTVADPWAALARIALVERDTTAAIALLDSALARNPADQESRRALNGLRAARRVP